MKPVITTLLFFTALCISFLVSGCQEAFTPRGTYQEKIVVYSVLTTKTDTQYVRLYTTYNPLEDSPLSNTSDPQLTDATLSISNGLKTYTFHDTLLPRTNTSRYTSDIHVQVSYGFTVERGKSYSLAVHSPTYGDVTSTLTTVSQSTVKLLNGVVLEDPVQYSQDIEIQIYLGKTCKAYSVHGYIEFQAYVGGQWVPTSAELPPFVSGGTPPPTLYYRGQNIYSGIDGVEKISFPVSEYVQVLRTISTKYPNGIKFSRSRFIVSQVDDNLFAYYNVVNGFPDAFTLRVDEPDYTNISGGLGIFGSLTEDAFTFSLPEKIKIP
jgi:hypothetical protein